ncbi:MAG: oligosaccharide flippase family protein [Acidimicrobiales bacterium]
MGTVWMGTAALIAAATGFGAAALLTRHWGPLLYGQYAALVAWGTIAAVLADGGLAQTLSKESAQRPDAMRSLYRLALRRRIVLSALVVVVVVALLGPTNQAVPTVIALAAVCATLQVDLGLDLSLTIWRVVGRYRSAALWRIARRTLYVAAVALGVAAGLGVTGVAVAILISGVPVALAAAVVCGRSAKGTSAGVDLPRYTTGLFWAAGVLYWVYFQADQLLLSVLSDHVQLGLYAPAVAVASVLLILTTVVAEVVLPRLFHLAARETVTYTEIRDRTLQQVPVFSMLAGLMAVVFAFFSEPITAVIFGPKFAGTAPLLGILGFFVALRYLAVPAFLAIQAIERLHYLVAVQATAAAVNIAGNVILIPRHGARGAAMATLVSETVMFVGVWAFLPRDWLRPALQLGVPFVALAAVALGAGEAAGGKPSGLRIAIAVGYTVAGAVVLVRTLRRDG